MRRASLLIVLVMCAITRAGLPTIRWDRATVRLIEAGADYPRMARLGDGSVGVVYDRGGQVCFRRSVDGGMTFGPVVSVGADAECWLTNAFLLPLRDGTLLYLWNERPRAAVERQHDMAPAGVLTRPFMIRAARSSDLGRTWAEPQAVYAGGTTFQDGCWEPAGIELPSGEVQVYFANESPFGTSDEQEISMVRSGDGGKTWSEAKRVGFRAGHRDGMPAPLLLGDGTVAMAVEDNGLAGGRFKIAVLSSATDWRDGPVMGDDRRRWPALAEALPGTTYAGAPFLVRLPGGETILSCQESQDGSLRDCRMAVYAGDARCRGFANRSMPFPTPERGNQAWNSLFVKSADTVTALSTATIGGVRGVYAVDGRVVR